MRKLKNDLAARLAREGDKQRRDKRAEKGLCINCGKRPPRAGNRLCEQCLQARRDGAKRTYEDRKARGICVKCGAAPARSGRIWCEECAKEIYQKRKEESENGI